MFSYLFSRRGFIKRYQKKHNTYESYFIQKIGYKKQKAIPAIIFLHCRKEAFPEPTGDNGEKYDESI